MPGRLSPILGTLSVLVFFVLLGFTVFGVVVQGQEGSQEEARPPGPHPLEGISTVEIFSPHRSPILTRYPPALASKKRGSSA